METTQTKTPLLAPETRRRLMKVGGFAIVLLAAAGVGTYLIFTQHEVAIGTASISAPLIDLSPKAAGRLDAVYAQVGDTLPANAPVALVGTEVVRTKVAGLVVQVTDTVGAQIAPGQAIAEMIDPSQLRVVGRIDENKGLSQIQVGDPVHFTVDAFGSRTFTGVIDEIVPTSNASGVLFNISSQRQVQQFDVKARFDTSAYPFLKNGMSARMWVYTP